MFGDNNQRIAAPNHTANRVCVAVRACVKQMISRKPMEEIGRELFGRQTLKKQLHWFELLCIGIGGTIGKWDAYWNIRQDS